MKRIAVTGALGHIGAHFVRALKPGMYARVDLIGRPTSHRYAGLLQLPPQVPFRYVHADICRDDFSAVAADVDVVIHLAAATATDDEALLESVNVAGTANVARACARAGARLVFVSTTSVYAGRDGSDIKTVPAKDYKPHSPYALSKWRAERLLLDMVERDGLKATVCRFGTVYGPSYGMRFHTAVNKFVWQACVDQPLTVWRSSMDQLRPYLHVDDATRILRFVTAFDDDGVELFDAASNNSTVRDVVTILQSLFPGLRVGYVDSPLMNDHSFSVENGPLCRRGFEFRGNLSDGILETVGWLRGLCGDRLVLPEGKRI